MEDFAETSGAVKLSNATLQDLPANVVRPTYDRTKLTPGIVHIGLGNFHRAHQAWYIHRLMQAGKAHDWAIIGAGVRAFDEEQRAKLAAQDYLTTLIELDPDSTSAEVVGSMIDYLPIQENNHALIQQMADPAIRIVALTVTEGGYFLDPATKSFDASHPDIQHDVANPDTPRTAFGAMVAALRLRRRAGIKPFTCQSCDNLPGNGAILHEVVVGLARLSNPDLASWIDENATFPNSMVDCIVPATGSKEIELAQHLGINDAAPVTHEPYRQWVIEDRFCNDRPNWETVGATISNNVHDFEAMKLRILNGGHQVLANAGEILQLETIADCMAHPLVCGFFNKVEAEEIAPTVAAVPGMEPQAYAELIARRFSNPRFLATTRRVAFDGAARHTGFVLPILRDQLANGGAVEGLALVEALWARMCAGTRENGSRIEANDPFWDDLTEGANRAKERPAAWLEQSRFYGELSAAKPFAQAFEKWLARLWEDGAEATLRLYVEG